MKSLKEVPEGVKEFILTENDELPKNAIKYEPPIQIY